MRVGIAAVLMALGLLVWLSSGSLVAVAGSGPDCPPGYTAYFLPDFSGKTAKEISAAPDQAKVTLPRGRYFYVGASNIQGGDAPGLYGRICHSVDRFSLLNLDDPLDILIAGIVIGLTLGWLGVLAPLVQQNLTGRSLWRYHTTSADDPVSDDAIPESETYITKTYW